MGYGIRVEVWGEFALFTRPETKVERVSYDVMTPSAARGILEAIYWKPALLYKIDRIYVLSPIRFTNIRRNELSAKGSADEALSALKGSGKPLYIDRAAAIQQRAATVLRDVRYVIEAHFELTGRAGDGDTEEKHYAILMRRLKMGQTFHQPYLGCREFPARFRPYEGVPEPRTEPEMTRDLGLMLYDMDHGNPEDIRPSFFRARLEGGAMTVADCEVMF
ncbi:MAG TPA: type I-C CRISPR-associated protein Cas5c [Clostridia bacterium]|nr:type I-C CRISPR-associated protein Cas5c [Clostridia bacterium]